MKNVRLLLRMLAVSAMMCSVMLSPALADTFTYYITSPNAAVSPYPAAYADVLVNRTSGTTASITFTGNIVGAYQYLLGTNGAADVNVNASTWTITSIAGSSLPGLTVGPLSDGGSGNLSEFGVFNQSVNEFDGYSHSLTEISFLLTNTSGSWASATDVLVNNAAGYLAGAHIFVVNAADPTGGVVVTGYAANGPPVPEPGTMMLLGSGLVGLAGWGRKKFRR